ncbi:MAG: Pycsar system effector family protein [Sphingobacterium sp.]|uniref:Pycsar system effector family protein n=1 Tax=Sphingobacterium sp. JB170 TaxID=1434842 RepID=UPI00097EBB7D|nr:Pycsar system effector family protein [Sphingobacterium sp. JB170]SJN49542.1 Metal-dependent phosphohydrolase, HD subdomain [Sphingobacterium sp. JB170]
MDYTLLLEKTRQYVFNFLRENKAGAYCFHDNVHTDDVVAATKEIATHYDLTEEDRFVTLCAAYFHDTGYCSRQGSKQHEARSADLADKFLKEHHVTESVRQKVEGCIMATRMPQSPKNLLEEIVCDADLFHLGSDAFDRRNKLMHQEAEQLANFKIPKSVWRPLTIQLLTGHNYHTEYAKSKLDKEKSKNLNNLEKEEEKYHAKKDKNDSVKKRPNRGIETMFRVSTTNSQRLSDMADNKANILLTVNSIILSVLVAVLVQKLDSNQHLVFPTVMLLVAVVSTMVLAILSTIPKVSDGRFKPEDVDNKSVNLLFFGNFHQMSYSTYEEAMKKAMGDYDFLYSMLTRDVYSQGVVLGRKYRLLRYAYGVFMFGLVVSVFAFIVAVAFVV